MMKLAQSFKSLEISTSSFLLPLVSSLLWFLSLPPLGLTFFSWFALLPLLFFLKKASFKKALIGSLLAGLFHAVAVLWPLTSLEAWWWLSYGSFFAANKEIILFIFLIPAAFYTGSIFYIIWSLLFKKFAGDSVLSIFIFSFLWVALELLRLPLVLGFTWGVVGYNLHDYLYLRQLAYPFGVFGLSFVIIFVNLSIFLILKNFLGQKDNTFSLQSLVKNRTFQFLVLFILALNVYGMISINSLYKSDENPRSLKAAVLYSDLTTEESGVKAYLSYLDNVRQAVERGAELVVLPENFFPVFLLNRDTGLPLAYEHPGFNAKSLFDQFINISRSNPEISFIAGVHTIDKDLKNKMNSLVLIEKGKVSSIYDKRQLLPLTESNLTSGDYQKSSLKTKNGNASALICSEVIFPNLLRNNEEDFIIISSNDGIFSSSVVARYHHLITKVRAVENRKYTLRSVKKGVSAIIDPFGRVLTSSLQGVQESQSEDGIGFLIADISY
jgi:apolipoprotein N-acyltransferase